jgi:hypothetical protein
MTKHRNIMVHGEGPFEVVCIKCGKARTINGDGLRRILRKAYSGKCFGCARIEDGIKRRGSKNDVVKKLMMGKMGKDTPHWKGGISFDKKYVFWSKNRRNNLKRMLNKNGSFHTYGEWTTLKAQYNWTCPCCNKSEPSIKLTEDHIIPLSMGGGDNIENIQPLCGNCNSKKHTKIITFRRGGE